MKKENLISCHFFKILSWSGRPQTVKIMLFCYFLTISPSFPQYLGMNFENLTVLA